MNTVAESPHFLKKLAIHLTEAEHDELLDFIGDNPLAGAVMRGTGGVRKLRWAIEGSGKSGGIRIIYYFYNESIPLYMLDVYAKNEKENLTKQERNNLKKVVEMILKEHGIKK